MVKKTQTFDLRRWSARPPVRVGLPVVIAVLFSIVIVQLWTNNSKDLTVTKLERQGVEYLKPLTQLMIQSITAQSNAVLGNSSTTTSALRDAESRVDKVDKRYGENLGLSQRWRDIRSRIEYVVSLKPSGEAAYRSYTDLIQLIEELIHKLGDESNLVFDSVVDSYYLVDAGMRRLPDVLLFAGRAADLAALADKAGLVGESRQQTDIRVSAARYQVSRESDGVGEGLRKALETTKSTTLGPSITNYLDSFRSAVDAFVPPANLLYNLDKVDTATLTTHSQKVRETAGKLAVAVVSELDKLLRDRVDSQSIARSRGIQLGLLCIIFMIGLIWILVGPSPKTGKNDENSVPTPSAAGVTRADMGGYSSDEGYDSREVRATEELVHIGRGIRARRRERADNAR